MAKKASNASERAATTRAKQDARSFVGNVAAAHPNWFPQSGTAPRSAAGTALLTPTGSGPSPAAAGTTTPAPAPAAPAGPTAQPFLTPAQQQALDTWNATYSGEIGKLGQADTDALGLYNRTVADNNLANAQNQDLTNQEMAARGVAISSIHQGALNDLATTLAKQNNLALTNYNTTIANDQTSRETLTKTDTANQTYYAGLAVANAQGVTPSGAAPSPTPTSSAAAGGANPVPSAGGQANAQSAANNARAQQSAQTNQSAAAANPRSNLTPGLAGIGMAGAAGIRAAQHIRPPASASAGANLGLFANLTK